MKTLEIRPGDYLVFATSIDPPEAPRVRKQFTERFQAVIDADHVIVLPGNPYADFFVLRFVESKAGGEAHE